MVKKQTGLSLSYIPNHLGDADMWVFIFHLLLILFYIYKRISISCSFFKIENLIFFLTPYAINLIFSIPIYSNANKKKRGRGFDKIEI